MNEKYKHLRESIRQSCTTDCQKSIKESFRLLQVLLKDRVNKEDEWFCYYMISYNYYLMNEYELAVEYGKYAALTIKNADAVNYNRTIWHLGDCYKKFGKTREAIKMFKICSSYYRGKSNRLRLTCLFNIAELLEYTTIMEKILKLYIHEAESNDPTVYMQEKYEQSVIIQMYIGTVDMYIAQGKNDKAIRLIQSILDKDLKLQLSKKLLAA